LICPHKAHCPFERPPLDRICSLEGKRPRDNCQVKKNYLQS
jgi:hypothetical protein